MFSIDFYITDSGKCPVRKFLESLGRRSKAKIGAVLDQLEVEGPQLPMPHAKPIGNGLWELRVETEKQQHRVLYFFWTGETIVLLHGFTKKTEAISKKDLEIARDRMQDWMTQ
jgi:phage-related protein